MKIETREELEHLIKSAASKSAVNNSTTSNRATNNSGVRVVIKADEPKNKLSFLISGASRDTPFSSLESTPGFDILYQRTKRIHFSGSFENFYVVKLGDNAVGTAEIEAEGFRGSKNDAHGLISMHILAPHQNMESFAAGLVQENMKTMLKSVLPEFRDIVNDYADFLGESGVKAIVKEEVYASVFEKIFDQSEPQTSTM